MYFFFWKIKGINKIYNFIFLIVFLKELVDTKIKIQYLRWC